MKRTALADRLHADMNACLRASNEDWISWGERDPLFGVASLPGRSRTEERSWENDIEGFYSLGGLDWEAFKSAWDAYGRVDDCCVEIGCGAGRLSKHLAADFGCVLGVDVSLGMIERARPHMPVNVSLHLADGVSLPLEAESTTAAFSVCVFQHFENASIGLQYFEEIRRVLRAGGTFMIHVPVVLWPSGRLRWMYEACHAFRMVIADGKAALHRLQYRFGWKRQPYMRWTSYELEWLRTNLSAMGFVDLRMVAVWHGEMGDHGLHTFVFGRKGR